MDEKTIEEDFFEDEQVKQEEEKRAVDRLKQAFVTTFSTIDGKMVLANLQEFCRLDLSNCLLNDGAIDNTKLAILVGREDVSKHINDWVNLLTDKLY